MFGHEKRVFTGVATRHEGLVQAANGGTLFLDEMVKAGKFRPDLYYRLKVVPLAMPKPSAPCEDIPLLADHFLQQHAQANIKKMKYLSLESLDYLMAIGWPGNIRQLSNVIELCATLSKTKTIVLSLIKMECQDKSKKMETLKKARLEFERNYLLGVLEMSGVTLPMLQKLQEETAPNFINY